MLSKEYLIQLAYSLHQYGWVPISMKNKTPVGKNWQNLRNDPVKDAIDISQGRYPTRVRQIDHLYDAGLVNNVGVLTGEPSGIVVIDIEKNGIDQWNAIVRLNGLPKTFTVQSGEGGYHHYFKYHPYMSKIPNRNRILDYPIDFRTNGGVIVAPGSYSYSANNYYQVIENEPIAELPSWFFGLLINDILYREGIPNPTTEQFNQKRIELGL